VVSRETKIHYNI